MSHAFDEYGVAYIGLDDEFPGWYDMTDAILMFLKKIKVEGESESESEVVSFSDTSDEEIIITDSDSD